MDYLLLAGLMWEKNTILDWKFMTIYKQANRLKEQYFSYSKSTERYSPTSEQGSSRREGPLVHTSKRNVPSPSPLVHISSFF